MTKYKVLHLDGEKSLHMYGDETPEVLKNKFFPKGNNYCAGTAAWEGSTNASLPYYLNLGWEVVMLQGRYIVIRMVEEKGDET
jgi:hypothetical protein